MIGRTGSGKTVLMRELVRDIPWTVLLGTKNTDVELYGGYQAVGFEIVETFDPTPPREHSRVIFRPRRTGIGAAADRRQSERFGEVFNEVFEAGNWHIDVDEIWTIDNELRLGHELSYFWSAGRSEGITVVGGTQEPVNIPRIAFTASTHLFFFGMPDKQRIDRMAELSSGHNDLVKYVLPRLPKHEFLYIHADTREIVRSMVDL